MNLTSFISKSDSVKTSFFTSTIFTLVARSLNFILGIVIAAIFGISLKTDLYFYILSFLTLGVSIVTSINQTVLLPEFINLKKNNSSETAFNFINSFIIIYLSVSILIIFPFQIFYDKLIPYFSRFSHNDINENRELLHYLFTLFPIMIINGFFSDLLTGLKYFSLPLISVAINALFAIISVYIFKSELSIIIGLFVGNIISICVFLYILIKHESWKFKINHRLINRKIRKNIYMSQLGNLTSVFISFVPFYLLSGSKNGLITAYNFGKNLSEIPTVFLTSQFSIIIGIKFNELFSTKENEKIRNFYYKGLNFILFLLVPLSIFLFFFKSEIISFVYKRGSFDYEAVKTSSLFFGYFSLLLPFVAINTVVSRMLIAAKLIKYALIYQIAYNICMIIFVFPKLYYGEILNYLVSLVLINVANIILTIILMKLFFKMVDYLNTLKYLIVLYSVSITISILISFIVMRIENSSTRLLIGAILFTSIFLITNSLFNINSDFNKSFLANRFYKNKSDNITV